MALAGVILTLGQAAEGATCAAPYVICLDQARALLEPLLPHGRVLVDSVPSDVVHWQGDRSGWCVHRGA